MNYGTTSMSQVCLCVYNLVFVYLNLLCPLTRIKYTCVFVYLPWTNPSTGVHVNRKPLQWVRAPRFTQRQICIYFTTADYISSDCYVNRLY